MDLVIASHNLHKVRELKSMLKELPALDLLSLLDFPGFTLPPEIGRTFAENALLKAKACAEKLCKWVIADDSGLIVPTLGGIPGIYSARFAGENATDKENRLKLLSLLKGKVGFERSAYFECTIALVSPEGKTRLFSGTCEGSIATEEKGSSGFGYDPIFIKSDYSLTFAEMDERTKNRISHRRKAIDKLLLHLEALTNALH